MAYVVLGGCGDDSFEYFRFWLISRGREIFEKAMEDVDSLCDVFAEFTNPHDDDYPRDEEIDYAVMEVLAQRTGDSDYYFREIRNYEMPDYPREINFEWEEDDEESIRKICPRTFDRWYDNNVLDRIGGQFMQPMPSEESRRKGLLFRLVSFFKHLIQK